jgi:hypothetical protein
MRKVIIKLTKSNRNFGKVIRDIEIQKQITYEWLDLFRTLSGWLIKKSNENRIPVPTNNNLLSSYKDASIFLDKLEKINYSESSFKGYMYSINDFEYIREIVHNLMYSFKLHLLWFLHCCDNNHIDINLNYISDSINQSQRTILKLQKQLTDESLQLDRKAKTDGDLTEP